MALKKIKGNLCRNSATNLFQACDARKGGGKKKKARKKAGVSGVKKGAKCKKEKRVWSDFYGCYVKRCDAFTKPRKKTAKKKSKPRKKGKKKARKKSAKKKRR